MNNIQISNIQFKRVLNYNGNINDAIDCIKNKLSPELESGEPIIVSYLDKTIKKYFLALGIDKTIKSIQIFPMFENMNDFIEFINKIVTVSGQGVNDKNNSSESDISITKDSDGNFVLKLKAMVINADNVGYTYVNSEGETITITQDKFNFDITNRIDTFENKLSWKLI